MMKCWLTISWNEQLWLRNVTLLLCDTYDHKAINSSLISADPFQTINENFQEPAKWKPGHAHMIPFLIDLKGWNYPEDRETWSVLNVVELFYTTHKTM